MKKTKDECVLYLARGKAQEFCLGRAPGDRFLKESTDELSF